MSFRPDSRNTLEAKSRHVRWHQQLVSGNERNSRNQHPSFLIWLTGLPGSGKSTLAYALDRQLFDAGYQTYVLDGDGRAYDMACAATWVSRTRTVQKIFGA